MKRIEQWPPPDWAEVVVTWNWIMQSRRHDIKALFNKIDEQPGGQYHIHGKGEAKDFAFRFENPADATWFRLVMPN